MSVLDDLKLIHQRDAQDALGFAANQWKQLEQVYELDWKPQKKIQNIVLGGMGGSALAGLLSTTWPSFDIPFEISRNYDIPNYVGQNTLYIASSVSGNTEETLEAAGQAQQAGAQIVCMANGGKLKEFANKHNVPFMALPDSGQPRFGTLYMLKALITILERAEVVRVKDAEKTLHVAGEFLRNSLSAWLPEVQAAKNPAKQLAQELMGRSVVIYSGPKMYPAAYKWKISFNENAKNIAWCNQYPELNHNEFLGWTSHPHNKPYGVVELRSTLEHPRTQTRFAVTQKLLSGRRPAPEIVEVQGKDELQQLLWAVAFGDFVSLYLAILNGLNPTPVVLIEKFKRALQ